MKPKKQRRTPHVTPTLCKKDSKRNPWSNPQLRAKPTFHFSSAASRLLDLDPRGHKPCTKYKNLESESKIFAWGISMQIPFRYIIFPSLRAFRYYLTSLIPEM
ncbi:hypothetical protein CEXT_26311 [Caerostris extrusa]|uniref:Uncharacterized protein n=1 Tax=Caerostris extrusa TaxID=172846 RepID=A0AAV4QRL8_CAEEX|nr:hypothetical protein CEXT_26311 [Caerostris extrusa]